jgi:Copper transport outer membrane protein, MctB
VFDLRYHVASLAAVFLALVIGILVGVGLSGRGFVDDAERTNLNNQIRDLREERAAADRQLDTAEREARAMRDFAALSYPVLVGGRLNGASVAILVAGDVDPAIDVAVRQAIHDAGGRVERLRAIALPLRTEALARALDTEPALAGYADGRSLPLLGRDLASELVEGGPTPLWTAVARAIVVERDGRASAPVDGVVVVVTGPLDDDSMRLLGGVFSGLARSDAPAVGLDRGGVDPNAVPVLRRSGLSTVDGVETPAGRVALVLLLEGAANGSYGVEPAASDGVLPPFSPSG